MLKTVLYLAILVIIFDFCKSFEYPIIRDFKNCRLTFKSNESLTIEMNDTSANFFMIADQGGIPDPPYYTHILSHVSMLMAKLAKKHNTQFQFAMGDNFYFDGVQNVDDPRFQDSFEKVFNDSSLVNTPWFLSLGNHDYRGSASEADHYAQIEYTMKSKRWILPSYLYDLDIVLNSELLIKAVVIDTQKICDEGTDAEMGEYLQRVIERIEKFSETDAYYYIVLGHYPLWSIGELGPNYCMVKKLRDTLHKNKVDGYFTGHEHALQHFTDTYLNHTVEFLVSGATNFVIDTPINKDEINQDMIKYFWISGEDQQINCETCSGAIVLGKADKNLMNLRFIDTKENELYSFDLKTRRKASNSAEK
ncbi:tartrate-resistant acid phosphatase type 5-like isoform X1, partial [Brachionus plicatilis]